MIKEKPLYLRLYQEAVLYETARVIGYEGVPTAEIQERVKPLEDRFGKHRVESALYLLTTFQLPGQDRVRLREHVRKLCYQLLGYPPEHPDYARSKSPEPWRPAWLDPRPEPKPEEPAPKPKRSRKKKEA